MGLHDTFDFDEAAYRAKCAERPTSKLQQEEVKKLRQHFAASASMAIGLSHAVQVRVIYGFLHDLLSTAKTSPCSISTPPSARDHPAADAASCRPQASRSACLRLASAAIMSPRRSCPSSARSSRSVACLCMTWTSEMRMFSLTAQQPSHYPLSRSPDCSPMLLGSFRSGRRPWAWD